MYDIKNIIKRIKEMEGARYDTQVADVLAIDPRTLGNFKKRGTIPWWQIVEYCSKKSISLDWLIMGHGEPEAGPISNVADAGGIYKVRTDQDALIDLAAHVFAGTITSGKPFAPTAFKDILKFIHRLTLKGTEIDGEDIIEMVAGWAVDQQELDNYETTPKSIRSDANAYQFDEELLQTILKGLLNDTEEPWSTQDSEAFSQRVVDMYAEYDALGHVPTFPQSAQAASKHRSGG